MTMSTATTIPRINRIRFCVSVGVILVFRQQNYRVSCIARKKIYPSVFNLV